MPMDAKKLKGFAERDGGGKKPVKAKFGKKPSDDEEDTDDEDGEDTVNEKKGPPGNPGASNDNEDDKGDDDEGGEDEGSDEEIAAQVAARVASGKTDDEVMGHLEGYDPDEDGNPPEWVEDEDLWERAKKAVEPNWDSYDEPYAVVAHVYKQMHGKFK